MNRAKYAKAIKIVYTILMILVLISMANNVFAVNLTPDQLTGSNAGQEQIQGMGNDIIGFITMVGIVISVLVLVILGIKYMVGSASEKAEYKKTMIPYLIGAILVFAASSIATIVMNIANDFAETGTGG